MGELCLSCFIPQKMQEVKEAAISCTGLIVSLLGDVIEDQLAECMKILLDRLKNEITRLTTVKAWETFNCFFLVFFIFCFKSSFFFFFEFKCSLTFLFYFYLYVVIYFILFFIYLFDCKFCCLFLFCFV